MAQGVPGRGSPIYGAMSGRRSAGSAAEAEAEGQRGGWGAAGQARTRGRKEGGRRNRGESQAAPEPGVPGWFRRSRCHPGRHLQMPRVSVPLWSSLGPGGGTLTSSEHRVIGRTVGNWAGGGRGGEQARLSEAGRKGLGGGFGVQVIQGLPVPPPQHTIDLTSKFLPMVFFFSPFGNSSLSCNQVEWVWHFPAANHSRRLLPDQEGSEEGAPSVGLGCFKDSPTSPCDREGI